MRTTLRRRLFQESKSVRFADEKGVNPDSNISKQIPSALDLKKSKLKEVIFVGDDDADVVEVTDVLDAE